MTTKHETRCPACGRFIPVDADGYYATAPDGYGVACYCNATCADDGGDPDRQEDAEEARLDAIADEIDRDRSECPRCCRTRCACGI